MQSLISELKEVQQEIEKAEGNIDVAKQKLELFYHQLKISNETIVNAQNEVNILIATGDIGELEEAQQNLEEVEAIEAEKRKSIESKIKTFEFVLKDNEDILSARIEEKGDIEKAIRFEEAKKQVAIYNQLVDEFIEATKNFDGFNEFVDMNYRNSWVAKNLSKAIAKKDGRMEIVKVDSYNSRFKVLKEHDLID
jgi:hypothetical protein